MTDDKKTSSIDVPISDNTFDVSGWDVNVDTVLNGVVKESKEVEDEEESDDEFADEMLRDLEEKEKGEEGDDENTEETSDNSGTLEEVDHIEEKMANVESLREKVMKEVYVPRRTDDLKSDIAHFKLMFPYAVPSGTAEEHIEAADVDISDLLELFAKRQLSERELARAITIRKYKAMGDDETGAVAAHNKAAQMANPQTKLMSKALKNQLHYGGEMTYDYNGKMHHRSKKKGKYSGNNAVLKSSIFMRGVKTLRLLNSGFTIGIRSFNISEIESINNHINNITEQYETNVGALGYLYESIAVKDIVLLHAHKNIVFSNLEGYEDYERFVSCVSFHDYQSIVWAIVSAAHKHGITITYPCHECHHASNETIDLNHTRQNNMSLLSEECKNILKMKMVTPEICKKYRDNLLYVKDAKTNDRFDKRSYINEDEEEVSVDLQVPTLAEWFEGGRHFKNEILSYLDDDILNSDDITKRYNTSYFKAIAPWVKCVDEDGNLFVRSGDDIEADAAVFGQIVQDMQESFPLLYKDIQSFIMNSSVSIIGYPAKPCAYCKAVSKYAHNGFIPIDIETSFFTNAERRITINLRQMEG